MLAKSPATPDVFTVQAAMDHLVAATYAQAFNVAMGGEIDTAAAAARFWEDLADRHYHQHTQPSQDALVPTSESDR
jgi:hypothetical protein